MKLRLFAFLFLVVSTFTVTVAQENGTSGEEGENFWTEESGGSHATGNAAADSKVEDSEQPMPKPVKNSCSNRNELREEARLLLRPYRYNLAKTSMITMKRYPQKKLLIIPIYSKQGHRLVFSSKGMPQPYGIKVYDKHPEAEAKKAQVLFTANEEEFINTYELPENYEGQYIFVEYTIPPTDAENRDFTIKGCAIFYMGYMYISSEDSETVETGEE